MLRADKPSFLCNTPSKGQLKNGATHSGVKNILRSVFIKYHKNNKFLSLTDLALVQLNQSIAQGVNWMGRDLGDRGTYTSSNARALLQTVVV